MGYKAKSTIYESVSLSTGDTVTIQVYRGKAADLIDAALYRGEIAKRRTTTAADGTAAAEMEESLDTSALLYETCVQGIAKWALDGDPEPEGTVWPIDAAHVAELTSVDRIKVFQAIRALNSPLDPAAKNAGAPGS